MIGPKYSNIMQLFCMMNGKIPFLVLERCRRRVLGSGTLPQAPFFNEKTRFWSWCVAAGAFFLERDAFLVLERCRKRLSWVEKRVVSVGTLPQASFFGRKTRFWCWNVAAGAFFHQNMQFYDRPPVKFRIVIWGREKTKTKASIFPQPGLPWGS